MVFEKNTTITPPILPARKYWKVDGYVTYRRLWLDYFLEMFAQEMRGKVVDIGGKRENKRGTFQPPEHQSTSWWYINLDLITKPNVYGDVHYVPLSGNSVDCIICTEVLEHLPTPERCVGEIHRLLREDGVVFASIPFLYPVHGDPFDYQRFTEDGLRNLFREFKRVEIYHMGGYTGTLGLFLEIGVLGITGNSFRQKILRWFMKWISRWLCRYDLSVFGREDGWWSKFTTGYFVRAIR